MKRLILPFFMTFFLVLPSVAQRQGLYKLSPMLRRMAITTEREVKRMGNGRQVMMDGNRKKDVCAFIRITADADQIFKQYGCRELAHVGDIYIAGIPIDKLGTLAQERNVERIEAQRGTHVLMDETPRHLNALPVYAGTALPQAFTGRDVVVGVMDIGFDLTHPNFYDATATDYRIKRLWDQISPDTVGSPLYVGRDYTTQEELLALGCPYDGKIQTHGTHTLGIAAGSGYNSPYRGMAWESDLCLVNNATTEDISLIAPADYGKYTFAVDALGFKYIFDYADEVGKPCVISFSEGSPQDFYGYDVLYYEMLQELVGPGHILVAAAGNQGDFPSYLRKEHGQLRAGAFLKSSTDRVSVTAKADAPFTLRTTVYTVDPVIVDITSAEVLAKEDSCYEDSMMIGDRKYYFTVMAYPSCYVEKETCYDIELRMQGRLGLDVPLSVAFVGEEAEIEMYRNSGEIATNPLDPGLLGAEQTHNIHSPGSAPCVICVGATGYRTGIVNYLGDYREFDRGNDGRRSSYSSVGPTFDGRTKPDVMAPGSNIISSYSSFYLENNPTAGDILSDVEHFDFRGRTYSWNSNAGTSMSTPAVAGAIALWLQAKPTLTPEEVMEVISRTSSHYDSSMSYPNNEYGYGQIDVYRGLLDILGIDGIPGLSSQQLQTVRIVPLSGRRINLRFDETVGREFTVRVYNTAGRQVDTQNFDGQQMCYDLDLSQFPHGIYAIQVDTPQTSSTGSTLVRI